MGSFDESFLDDPAGSDPHHHPQQPEMLRAARRADGKLANRFILVANIEATDGGKAIVAGNERVIRARLSDAKFFYETDLKTSSKTGCRSSSRSSSTRSSARRRERIERIEQLAARARAVVGADPAQGRARGALAKADLLTEVVGEFPELQGLMGKYYALAQGEDDVRRRGIEDHYKPLGPDDRVPTDPVAIAVALADKIDTLVGFWAIDEKPTGSKDPYALRRAALGVIRIILDEQSPRSTWRHVRRSRPRAISNRARPSCGNSSARRARARTNCRA